MGWVCGVGRGGINENLARDSVQIWKRFGVEAEKEWRVGRKLEGRRGVVVWD